MSASSLLNPNNGELLRQFSPYKAYNVAYLASGNGLVAPVAQVVTLPYAGLYMIQSYIAKVGAGAVDSTTTTQFTCDASQGWGECSFTPAMIPPFATEPGVAVSMTSSFYAPAGPTVLRLLPGTALNVGAEGNCEAILWYIGSSDAN